MVSLATASLAFGLQLLASVDAEVAGGWLPLVGQTVSSEPSLTLTASPVLGLIEGTSRGPRFAASYSPRFFYRYPNPLELTRPLVLHNALVSYLPVLGPRTRLGLTADATMGELDYTAVRDVFGNAQTVAPEDAFIDVYRTDFSTFLDQVVSRRWQFRLVASGSYQTSFGAQSTIAAFGDTISVGLQPSATYALTRRDGLSISGGATLVLFETTDQLGTQATLGWQRELSSLTTMSVTAGLGRLDTLSREEDADDLGAPPNDTLYYGVGGFGIGHTRAAGSDSLVLSLDAYPDPFLQTVRPRATLTATSSEQVRRDVTFAGSLSASTVATRDPLASNLNETGVNLTLSAAWRKQYVTYRSGVRGGVRAPHLSQEFEARERLAMLFFGVYWDVVEAPSTGP